MQHRLAAILMWFTLAAASGTAAAGGAFFSRLGDVSVTEPKALLWWEDGRETLILQVKYQGRAQDFGWVVPVPGEPEIDAASGDLFLELAQVTRPPTAGAVRGRGGPPGGRASADGAVVKAERYGAAMLPADDPGALVGWLRERGYAVSARAERVLGGYAKQGWHCVALRVDTSEAHAGLLAALREVVPSVADTMQAPEAVAAAVLRAAEARDPGFLTSVEGVADLIDRAHPVAGGGQMPSDWTSPGTSYRQKEEDLYRRLCDVRPRLAEDAVPLAEVTEWLRSHRGDEARVLATARSAGFKQTKGLAGLAEELRSAVNADLIANVPYERSSLQRLGAALRGTSGRERGPQRRPSLEYEPRRNLVARYLAAPPPERTSQAYRSARAAQVEEGTTPGKPSWSFDEWTAEISRATVLRSDIYHLTADTVRGAIDASENALASGTIQPLKLTFDTPRLVYPLQLTGANQGEVRLELWVLSEGEVAPAGPGGTVGRAFGRTFGERLSDASLSSAPNLAQVVGDGRQYLTKLSGTLRADQIAADLYLVPGSIARRGRAVSMPGGRAHDAHWTSDTWVWLASWLVLPLALLAGILLLKAVMRKKPG